MSRFVVTLKTGNKCTSVCEDDLDHKKSCELASKLTLNNLDKIREIFPRLDPVGMGSVDAGKYNEHLSKKMIPESAQFILEMLPEENGNILYKDLLRRVNYAIESARLYIYSK